ncbi:DsbA family oxidoreductase [Clostridium sp. MB05]
MKVEIWSDIFCPFCYIGKRRFEAALEKFDNSLEVEVIYRSFELNPSSPKHYEEDIHALIASKYGMSYEEAKLNNDNIIKQAATLGLTYNFDTLIPTNSFDAHRMIHFANKYRKMEEMTEGLFKAYFTDSKDVSDYEILANIVASIGLDKEEALEVLNNNDYEESVRRDEKRGSQLGITGVPFFVFNDKFAVSGAQSTDIFLNALNKVLEDEKISVALNNENSVNICTDGYCKN